MKQIFDQFDYVRIINLKERADRRRAVLQEFDRARIAVDGEHIGFFTAERFPDKGGFPTIGARGCFSSHREVMKEALRRGARNALVLEDDIAFNDVSAQSVSTIASAVRNAQWDLVYFGYSRPLAVESDAPLTAWSEDTLGGHFYGVSRSFMEEMAAFMDACETRPAGDPEGGPMFRDGAFNFYRQRHPDLKTYLANPCLACQRLSRTDLHDLRIYDRIPLLNRFAQAARGLRNLVKL